MEISDATILTAATTTLSAAILMTVAISIEIERQRQRLLVVKRRPRYRLPLAIPQGPDFNLEMFNEAWALEFLRHRFGIPVDDKTI